jgi:hypothetical protein
MNEILKKYSESPRVRALVNIVPYIGGALDVLLSEKGVKWRQDRMKQLLSQLEAKVELLDEQNYKLVSKKMEQEDFYDLFIQAMESSMRTRHNEKISYYANILFNHAIIKAEKDTNFDSELVISTLDLITLNEINYLAEIYNRKGEVVVHKIRGEQVVISDYLSHIKNSNHTPSDYSYLPVECLYQYDSEVIWSMLSNKSLVLIEKETGFERHKYTKKGPVTIEGNFQTNAKNTCKITKYGEEFINWIKDKSP